MWSYLHYGRYEIVFYCHGNSGWKAIRSYSSQDFSVSNAVLHVQIKQYKQLTSPDKKMDILTFIKNELMESEYCDGKHNILIQLLPLGGQ